MHRGSTPVIQFDFEKDVPLEKLTNINIAFAQNGNVILTKFLSDCTIEGNSVKLRFTEDETLMFKTERDYKAYIDVQIKLGFRDRRIISEILQLIISPILKDGEMENDPYISIVAVPTIRTENGNIIAETDQQAGVVKQPEHKETIVAANELEPNLKPENIKKGETIFGINGEFDKKIAPSVNFTATKAGENVFDAASIDPTNEGMKQAIVDVPLEEGLQFKIPRPIYEYGIHTEYHTINPTGNNFGLKNATVSINYQQFPVFSAIPGDYDANKLYGADYFGNKIRLANNTSISTATGMGCYLDYAECVNPYNIREFMFPVDTEIEFCRGLYIDCQYLFLNTYNRKENHFRVNNFFGNRFVVKSKYVYSGTPAASAAFRYPIVVDFDNYVGGHFSFVSVYNNHKDAILILRSETAFATLATTNHPFQKIYVADNLVNDYKTATNWSSYSSYIYPISSLPSSYDWHAPTE